MGDPRCRRRWRRSPSIRHISAKRFVEIRLTDMKTMDILRERQRMTQAVKRLERKGYLERLRKERSTALRLTELGERMVCIRRPPRHLPDGVFTVVSYDIPERQNVARQSFRRYLKEAGFMRRHHSVWISDRDWSESLRHDLHRLGISEWVVVIIGQIVSTPRET